jgi:hypothetical protein
VLHQKVRKHSVHTYEHTQHMARGHGSQLEELLGPKVRATRES